MLQTKLIISGLYRNTWIRTVAYLGIIIAIVCSCFALAYVNREQNYDRFHANAGSIYRLTAKTEGLQDARMCVFSAKWTKQQFPQIKAIATLTTLRGSKIKMGDLFYENEHIYLINKDFPETFSFPLLSGDYNTFFANTNGAILTLPMAKKLFGSENVLGRKITLNSRDFEKERLFTVVGVLKDIPQNSHIKPEVLIHNQKEDTYWPYVYLLLNKGITPKSIEQRYDSIYNLKDQFHLTALTNIHLKSNKTNELELPGNETVVSLIKVAVWILILFSVINLLIIQWLLYYNNIKYFSTLRNNGANKISLLSYALGNGMIISVVVCLTGALTIACISTFSSFSVLDWLTFPQIALIIITWITIIFLAEILPIAVWIIRTESGKQKHIKNESTVKIFAVCQLGVSIFFIVVSVFVYKQLYFIKNEQLGAKEHNLVLIELNQWQRKGEYDHLKQELLKHSYFDDVTSAMQPPGSGIRDGIQCIINKIDTINPSLFVGSPNFLSFFHFKPVAGSLFANYPFDWKSESDEVNRFQKESENKPNVSNTFADQFIINKAALELFKCKTANEAIGKQVITNHQLISFIPGGTIVGVIDSFRFCSLFEKEVPMLIVQRQLLTASILIRYNSKSQAQAMKILAEKWKAIYPDYPLTYKIMPDVYHEIYHNEELLQNVVGIFSFISIALSILGLLGIISFIISKRTKEIGIRKVNGASNLKIMLLLNKNLLGGMFLAWIAASVLAYYAVGKWLQTFAYHTDISWWVFVLAGGFVMLVSSITISWQSWQAAKRNPVESLRYE